MATETELKLSLPASETERFIQHPLLADSEAHHQHLLGTYYDTPDLELLKAKFGLRIRREGERWIQTLKTAGDGLGGLHQRHEWEAEVANNQLEFASLPKVVREGVLADKSLCERIVAVFTSDFQRTTWLFHTPKNSLIEICLDQGEVRQGDKTAPLCEVELELKQGEAADLFALALQLQADFPLVLENASKAQRGYELAHPRNIAAVTPSLPSLTAELSAGEAFSRLLWHYLAHLQANEAAALYEDTAVEGLTQLCHAVHRLQSCFAMCRKWLPVHSTAPLLAELDWLEQELHTAHSWDEFNDILEAIELQVGQQAALRELAVIVARIRLQAHESLIAILTTPRYTRFILQLNLWLLQQAWQQDVSADRLEKWQCALPEFARKRLSKQHKRLQAWPKSLAQLSAKEQARLWQEGARMDAVLEFFADFYQQDKSTRTKQQHYRDWLAQLCGTLNSQREAETAQQLFAQAGLDTEHPAYHFLQGWYAAKHHLKKATVEQTWIRFCKQKVFWKPKT